MASQNPFINFFSSEDRLSLARKIVQGISDFNPAACAKIALTFALNPSLMDDLTMKDSRRIMELAKLCSEVPWNLPESDVLAPEQSALPTHDLAEPRTTDAAPAALAVAAQSAPAASIVAGQSATASAEVAAQSATASADVAARSATAPPAVAPMPQVFAQLLPHVITEPGLSAVPAPAPSASTALDTARPSVTHPSAATNQPTVHQPASQPQAVAITSADHASADQNLSKTDALVVSSASTGVATSNLAFPVSGASSVFASDKQVLSSGSLNFQVPSSFSLCSKSESRVIFPFHSSQSHNINFGSFSHPLSSESVSDLVSSDKLVSDVIKSHDVSLVTKLPTSDLSLDSIRVSVPEIQSVPLVSVPFSAPDQCNPVASRTRKSKAKLANRVIPAAPSVKRKLIMDSISDVEPPRKSQKSVSTRQLRGQVSVSHSLQKPSGFPLPILLNKSVQAAWSINRDRSLLLQRNIDVENFTACCNLIDLLRSQNLLQTVTNVGPYCDLVTREFYSNLTEATVDRDGDHFHNVFLRRHWYDFSPAVINDFFDRTEVDVQFSPDYDLIASSLSNSHYRTWPKRDTKKPGESVSSTRSRVSVDFAAVSARVLTTQSIIKSLKSTVVQMEKVLLEDQMLLQSFETDEMDLDSAR
nr:uncharacterized protein LOC109181161 [Ipomoea trifida]